MAQLKFKEDDEGNLTKVAIGMFSKENEYVDFVEECDCSGQVQYKLLDFVHTPLSLNCFFFLYVFHYRLKFGSIVSWTHHVQRSDINKLKPLCLTKKSLVTNGCLTFPLKSLCVVLRSGGQRRSESRLLD